MSYVHIVKSYTTVKLADRLGVARDTLYRWMRAKKIKAAKVVRIGTVTVRLWTEKDVASISKWMKENPRSDRGQKKRARRPEVRAQKRKTQR
jgi:excisionase family DNA binding protein